MKRKFIWSSLSLLLAAAMLLASCGTTTSTTTPATTTSAVVTTTTAAGATVLTVTEGSQVKTYSMAALQALPSISGSGGSLDRKSVV